MSKLIAVDAGHGLHTAGKRTPDGEREWKFNNKVVLALINELHRLGLRTLRLDDPSGQRDVPLGERTRKANNAKADVLVSVHHNANTGKWGTWTGTETYSYPKSTEGAKLSRIVQTEMVKAYGLRNRGTKTANFHMVRESNMPAILTEGGYMDSRIDIIKMRDNEVLRQVGINIARGVAEYLDVKVSKPVTPSTPKGSEPKVMKQGNLYRVQVGAFSKKENAEQLAQELKAKGYPVYIPDAEEVTVTEAKPVAPPKPQPTQAWTGQVLRQGNRGDAVRQLQEMLAKKYFYPDKGAKNNGIDGIYGANTKNAVERFQSINGLKVDGIAGPATYQKLK